MVWSLAKSLLLSKLKNIITGDHFREHVILADVGRKFMIPLSSTTTTLTCRVQDHVVVEVTWIVIDVIDIEHGNVVHHHVDLEHMTISIIIRERDATMFMMVYNID